MADGTVGILQAAVPDRLIDNAIYENENDETVYRQRVEDPETMAILRSLWETMARFGTAFDPQGRLRINPDQIGGATSLPVTGPLTSAQTLTGVTTVTTVTTTTTVGTLTTMANMAPAGVTNPTHYLFNQLALSLRNQIAVT